MKTLITDYLIIAMLMVGVYACASHAQSPCDTTLTRELRISIFRHIADSIACPEDYQTATKGYVNKRDSRMLSDAELIAGMKVNELRGEVAVDEMRKENKVKYLSTFDFLWKTVITGIVVILAVREFQ